MQQKPLEILVTNDDGYTARGINLLASMLTAYGNVTVVAPDQAQSGMSAALSLGRPLRLFQRSSEIYNNGNRLEVYSLTGSPADCVKMAMNKFYKAGGSEVMTRDSIDRGYKPDIIFSGINHGSNASVASVYSGTLGAAAEGALYGVKSVGLSIDTHNPNPDFDMISDYLKKVVEMTINNPIPEGTYLNVNFPAIDKSQIKGTRFAKQGDGMWIKEFEQRKDPYGKDYYWMTGVFVDKEPQAMGDHNLVGEGYITVVPHKIDTTNYELLQKMEREWVL